MARVTQRRAAKGPCSVDGCEKPAAKRGWCGMHYRRWRLSGSVGEAESRRLPRHSPCRVIGCDRPNVGRGWCSRHYQQWWSGTEAGIKSRPDTNVGNVYRPASLDAMVEVVPDLSYLLEWDDPTANDAIELVRRATAPDEWDFLREAI